MAFRVTLRGKTASVVWGYQPAASLGSWVVCREVDEAKGKATWTLTARLGTTVDRFRLRQRPLLFTAPRHGGFWCWPVQQVTVLETKLTATLGPPEQ